LFAEDDFALLDKQNFDGVVLPVFEKNFVRKSEIRIAQFTDIHFANSEKDARKSIHLIENVIERVQPHLVVLTGDIIDPLIGCESPSEMKFILSVLNEHG
jgi:predicted MPP superfamily phosphohydrolase